MVGELNALLEATQTKGPYHLVGHSFGGLLMRLFASAESASVYGLVLVKSIHHRQFSSQNQSKIATFMLAKFLRVTVAL